MTDPIEFEQEENFPPSIESPTPMEPDDHPLNELIIIDLSEDEPLDGEIELDVLVRDPNVDQSLDWFLFLDNSPNEIDGNVWPPEGVAVRDKTVTVDESHFSTPETCRRIDLFVSSLFDRFDQRVPAEEGDLATAHWWVFTRRGPGELVNPSKCPGRM